MKGPTVLVQWSGWDNGYIEYHGCHGTVTLKGWRRISFGVAGVDVT